jgi:hypothetical protein
MDKAPVFGTGNGGSIPSEGRDEEKSMRELSPIHIVQGLIDLTES